MSTFCQNCGEPHQLFVDAVRCDIDARGEQWTRATLLQFTSPADVDELIRLALISP